MREQHLRRGAAFHEELVTGPIAPGGSTTFNASLSGFPKDLSVLVYAVVDPDGTIAECNDGNNKTSAPDKAVCSIVK